MVFLGATGKPVKLRAHQAWNYHVRRPWDRRVGLVPRPSGIHRIIQPVGLGDRQFSYRIGFCLRLPGNRILLVHRRYR